MMDVILNNKQLFHIQIADIEGLHREIANRLNLTPNEYYLLSNGRIFHPESPDKNGQVHIIPRLIGGKGGFGSMLRAIGAQIEKTTNREACRDLSGRRLRDINEEQRLKNWIATQADREREAAQRKRKKLETLCEEPKYEFKDDGYEKERSLLPEIVEDAVLQGFQASCSNSSNGGVAPTNNANGKRKLEEANGKQVPKKKKKLWIDDEISSDEDGTDDDDNEEQEDTIDNKKLEIKKHKETSQNDTGVNTEQEVEKISQDVDSAKVIKSLSSK